jgi:hypothetical protein
MLINPQYKQKEAAMSECNENSCSTETSCQTECCETGESKCPSQAFFNETCCPVEKAVQKWGASFPVAMKEVQVEFLKARIKKEWGAYLEKEADAVIESMGTFWTSMMAQAKARKDLSETFAKIFESAK